MSLELITILQLTKIMSIAFLYNSSFIIYEQKSDPMTYATSFELSNCIGNLLSAFVPFAARLDEETHCFLIMTICVLGALTSQLLITK